MLQPNIENGLRRSVYIIYVLLLAIVAFRLAAMAFLPLMDTTEARYAEIGRAMAESNDWITPWFDKDVPFWGKPPLAFWITAISFKLFGVNEFAARIPHFLVSVLLVGLTAWWAGLRDRKLVLPIIVILLSSALYFVSAGAVMTDIELALGITLAMTGYWSALNDTDKPNRNLKASSAVLFFGGLITGILAKGPISLILTAFPIIAWTAYYRAWPKAWSSLPWITGTLITLAMSLPWFAMAEIKTPGFLEYFIVGEHWNRYLIPAWSGDRYGHPHHYPIGSIWAFAFVDTLPWSIVLPITAWQWAKKKALQINKNAISVSVFPFGEDSKWTFYLLLWMLTPLLFFTAARNIMWTYFLSSLPAFAVLASLWLRRNAPAEHDMHRVLISGLVALLAVTLIVVTIRFSNEEKINEKSAKAMLAQYLQDVNQREHNGQNNIRNAPLIFVQTRPFSGQFYSYGKAIKITDLEAAWQRIGLEAAYVASQDSSLFKAAMPDLDPSVDEISQSNTSTRAKKNTQNRVTILGRFGNFDLLYIQPVSSDPSNPD